MRLEIAFVGAKLIRIFELQRNHVNNQKTIKKSIFAVESSLAIGGRGDACRFLEIGAEE